jgi:hypothetical protein
MDEQHQAERVGAAERREHWRRVLEEQRASGQSAAVFCRARGVPPWKFAYWRKALDGGVGVASATEGFVELGRTRGESGVCVEVGRWRVHVDTGFDPATLRRTVEALTAS